MACTEDEALRARERYKQAEKEGMLAALEPITVSEYVHTWLPLHKANVSKASYNNYSAKLEHGLKVIGNLNLEDVKIDDVMRIWQQCGDLSGSTVKGIKSLFTEVFDSAIENDLCRKNPFRSPSARPPHLASGSHRALTSEEIKLVENTPHRFQVAAMVMLYAGLRRGEVAALTMDDIDLKDGVIHVTKQFIYEKGQPVLSHTKTASGVRDVPIFPPLRKFLENRIGIIMPRRNGDFTTESALSRGWDSYNKALTLAAGHEVKIRMHDLRHTFCTMLRDAGVDMHQAMIWMGHANEKMIIHIYDHVGDERTNSSIKQVEKMLLSRQNGRQKKIWHLKSAVK